MPTVLRDFRKKKIRLGENPVIVWPYKPTMRQVEFHRCPAKYKLYGGAMGGGKSVALCAEAIKLSLKYAGNRGYMCRHQLVDFKRSTLITFERFCPPEFLKAHYRDDRILLFRNGSEILYGGLGGEEDLEKIKSTEFGWFAIDEATETYPEMWMLLCSRLRWICHNGVHPKYVGFVASNPEPGWVKERFVDRQLPDHAFIKALPRDNPYLPKNYDADLRKDWPAEWVNRYLEGSWDVFTGQIYVEFNRDRHVYEHMEMSPYWEHIRVTDHGYRNPTCCLWIAIDFDGRMIVYDEHYLANEVIENHAKMIIDRYPKFKGLTLGDPSMFSNTMQKYGKAWSPADEYRENGIVIIKPFGESGHQSEATGIQLVKQRLLKDSLLIHKRCINTISEIIKYRWLDLKANIKDQRNAPEIPMDKDNHAVDCLKYANMWRPVGSAPPKAPELVPGTLHWEIAKYRKNLSKPFFVGWN